MPKTKQKTKSKPAPKPAAKSASKSAGTAKAKVADKKLKPLAKVALVVGKLLAKKEAPKKVDAKNNKKPLKPVVGKASNKDLKEKNEKPEKMAKVPTAPVKAKTSKPDKNAKKKKKSDEVDFDDDLLSSDEEIGSEDIPDLSEFEETETAEEEDADVDDDDPNSSWVAGEKQASDDEVILTDAEGRRYCRVRDCDQIGSVEGYCRFHYLLLWKRIQVRRKILADGKLERYVEELTSRYPDKFLEMIKRDVKTEKDFLQAIAELEIDESAGENELEDEAQSYIDEVRGISPESAITDDEDF